MFIVLTAGLVAGPATNAMAETVETEISPFGYTGVSYRHYSTTQISSTMSPAGNSDGKTASEDDRKLYFSWSSVFIPTLYADPYQIGKYHLPSSFHCR